MGLATLRKMLYPLLGLETEGSVAGAAAFVSQQGRSQRSGHPECTVLPRSEPNKPVDKEAH